MNNIVLESLGYIRQEIERLGPWTDDNPSPINREHMRHLRRIELLLISMSEQRPLRDHFAGQALAGMAARDSYDEGQATPEMRATLAYIEADAMLTARERQQKQKGG